MVKGQKMNQSFIGEKLAFILVLAFFVMIGVVFGTISLARADCPDRVECVIPVPWPEEGVWHKKVGDIHTSTCYRFLQGCKPWFCNNENRYTNQSYWDQACWSRFSSTNPKLPCTHDNACYAEFPLW